MTVCEGYVRPEDQDLSPALSSHNEGKEQCRVWGSIFDAALDGA
jgi:hypothetical protein